jgi:hypothetical protein
MKSPFLEPAAAAAAIPLAGAFGRVRVACDARGRRRVVGACLARSGRDRPRVLVAALPEPLDQLLLSLEGAAAPAPEVSPVKSKSGNVACFICFTLIN